MDRKDDDVRSLRSHYQAPLRKEAFRITVPEAETADVALQAYLHNARFEIAAVDESAPLEARLAHYAHITMGLLSTPPMTVRWQRDELPKARAMMLFVRQGEVVVTGSGAVINRGKKAVFIPPGVTRLEIATTAPKNELIYISVAEHIVPDVAVPAKVDAPPIAWRRIAPLYAFMHAICSTPAPPEGEPDFLVACTNAIVESAVRTILGDISTSESLVLRVQAFIDEYHANPAMTLAWIATHFEVAVRTLQAAFAEEGMTVSGELRDARRRSVGQLRERNPGITQREVAQLAGFSSTSAMYRALKDEPRN